MRRTTFAAGESGRLSDLATAVLTAGGAGDVLRLELPAGPVRALDQVHRGGLPLRAPRAGVRARHSPLGDGPGYFSLTHKCTESAQLPTRTLAEPLGQRGPSMVNGLMPVIWTEF